MVSAMTEDDWGRLLYLVALLAFLLIGGQRLRRSELGDSAKALLVWAGVILVLITLYVYRGPLQRFAAPILDELSPSRVVMLDGGSQVAIARAPDGHFRFDARINGREVPMMVDTGATTTTLSFRDAERAGIATRDLSFRTLVSTANGTATAARTRVSTLEIGGLEFRDIGVLVARPEALDDSLLGLNALDRLRSWRFENNRLMLVP